MDFPAPTMSGGDVKSSRPAWAVEAVQISALVGFAAHSYVWWRMYQILSAPSAEYGLDPRWLILPVLLGTLVLAAAYRIRPWACSVLLGATFVGLVGGLMWLAGALTGEDVLGVATLSSAIDRTVFFLVPSLIFGPLAAACARLGLFTDGEAPRRSPTSLPQ